ncbi:MAG: hypothetical protein KJ630_12770 [Proteobacteria bacterium]|nr:hypothetical protein [Pseudomonadota bacterium]
MNGYFFLYRPLLRNNLSLLLVLLLLVACRSDAEHNQRTDRQPHFLDINTFRIPVLATPEDQLSYARADFEEIEEKSAALQAIKVVHPISRLHAAMADLDLAYLQLGADYRLANDRQCAQAREKYLAILQDYSDYPDIVAKSLWYLGWIACDLCHDKHQGLTYFKEIIDKYHQEIVNFLHPAPWLTIRPTDDGKKHRPSYPKSALTWAAIAHLEIIRHTASQEEAWHSFSAIAEKYGNDDFKGLALKTLIAAHGFSERAEREVRKYLTEGTADKALKDDLHLALANLRDEPPEARTQ